MEKRRLRCKNCGKSFVMQVFEPGEAEAKRVRTGPVQCPDCGSTDLVKD